MPPVARSAPRRSKFSSRFLTPSGWISRKTAPSTNTQATGLTNITQRHPSPWVKSPPSSTPAADANPPTPPHAPSAVCLSLPSLNVVVRIDSAAGSVMAAPTPWPRRAPIRTPELAAKPPISDEIPITAMPPTSSRRRPSRSANRPPRSMKPP